MLRLGLQTRVLEAVKKGSRLCQFMSAQAQHEALSGASTAIVATSLVKREAFLSLRGKPAWPYVCRSGLRMFRAGEPQALLHQLQSSCQFSIGAATQGTWLTGNHPKVS